MTQENSSCNSRDVEASQNIADGTLSPNSRELEDREVIDVTELALEGHGIAQDAEDILDANHVSPSMVNNEELPLKQVRAGTPLSPLPQNKGKGRAQTPSEDSMITRPRCTPSWISWRDPSHDDERPHRLTPYHCNRLVPRVVGSSIPHASYGNAYFLFVLTHFKPFSISHHLLDNPSQLFSVAFDDFSFDSSAKSVINNWEAAHECQDEHDAECLRKRAALTKET
jgi:hypothetical protein